MKTLLTLKTSLYSQQGESSRLADAFAQAWQAREPASRIIVRDLAADPVPHLTAERFGAFLAKPEERTAEQQGVVDYSDRLIAELKDADAIAIGLPLYNFGVPSMLKAYFDHIARAGVTFRYTAEGSVGLLTGKKAYVFATRGGRYAGSPLDNQTAYLRQFLAFLGITDVEFVYAEGLAIGPDVKKAALARAQRTVADLVREPLPVAA
jgi:FMN-dependent NADH-azoreductase